MTASQATSLFLGLAAVVFLARVMGAAARAIGQPAVLGEILVGVVLGPTLFHGALTRYLFPASIQPFMTALAGLGLALFMFGVGHEVEYALIRDRGRVAAGVSLSSILLPFGLGAALALQLVGRHSTVSHTGFVLFMGAAMSVTAFPVLARILTDRGMQRTRIGSLALACASIDDVLSWSLLAVVTAVVGRSGQWHILLAPLYLAVLAGIGRPLFRRLFAAVGEGRLGRSALFAAVLTGLMLSCGATEWMGIHYMFGAFFFGLVLPRGATRSVRERLNQDFGTLGTVLLLPIFFVTAGLKVDLSHLNATSLGELGLILLVAICGKFVGAFAGARLQGVSTRDSGVLATLMNARGLTELVILTVGLQLGFLDRTLYSLMVVMALTTTFMTGPLLGLLYPQPRIAADAALAAELLEPARAA